MCALWIDQHRPHNLDDLTIQSNANELLKSISGSFDFPHLLFCGPPGSGKKTRVLAFLRKLFNAELTHLASGFRTIEEGDKKIEVQVTSSDFHIEITPADAGMNDRHVISYFLKDVAASQVVGGFSIKVVVINEAHRLSKLAQQALRRTMEKYAKSCRIILIADSLSQIIEPVRSRCLVIRTPRIPSADIATAVKEVASKENFEISDEQLTDLVNESIGNLRRAINLLEMLSMQKKGGSVQSILPEWERYTDELVQILIEGKLQTETIKEIRVHLYELLVHCVPPTEILRRIVHGILHQIDSNLVEKVASTAAFYEARMQQGSKPIFHLEAFCARFICIYREYFSSW
ncbi:hypothetical protein TVAG_498820 [Trichomonas vaginalis G3]|uniref:ATPase, AAA family protein n=1 Tax=Trichomonas vaginalis (strain ATCC PRA-98 / G3) TaxID=412133 RepID=A2E870_TRIV3|nr:DNA replication [Trichomonas vaginalis G3]EAY11188.1 hypothetical protein TVAG_498820 [Trichomonas vaginalis G3]KAI5487301.1 DNA replication [Trichomonas vaginalis G3]|eukprot:XP_001323411.1 hypothetical protein [Trichomonas vaginalis G3]